MIRAVSIRLALIIRIDQKALVPLCRQRCNRLPVHPIGPRLPAARLPQMVTGENYRAAHLPIRRMAMAADPGNTAGTTL